MLELRQSTQRVVRVGPAMDATDAVTPETTLALSTADQAELLKATGAVVDISGATFAAITGADGWYDLTLTTSHTDTLGELTIIAQDTSLCLPVFFRAMVIDPYEWDRKYTAIGPVMSGVLASGTAQSVTASTIVLAAATAIADDHVNGAIVVITGGTLGLLQTRQITDWVSSTDTATISPNWTVNPTGTITYVVLAAPPVTTIPPAVNVTHVDGSAHDLPTATNLATVDTVVDAVKVKTDQLTFTKANEVDANAQSINGTTLVGDGGATPWGP